MWLGDRSDELDLDVPVLSQEDDVEHEVELDAPGSASDDDGVHDQLRVGKRTKAPVALHVLQCRVGSSGCNQAYGGVRGHGEHGHSSGVE